VTAVGQGEGSVLVSEKCDERRRENKNTVCNIPGGGSSLGSDTLLKTSVTGEHWEEKSWQQKDVRSSEDGRSSPTNVPVGLTVGVVVKDWESLLVEGTGQVSLSDGKTNGVGKTCVSVG
jgi:hypothetical protein